MNIDSSEENSILYELLVHAFRMDKRGRCSSKYKKIIAILDCSWFLQVSVFLLVQARRHLTMPSDSTIWILEKLSSGA